ncbi:EAL domain-containing protein [Methylophaga sp. SB9B]|uniref:bifunctional diguanylate cyclase/phosphodiesterase n=1 Tax=Methylophaga sp. SB9B TaxID=2570356 RepID=UPI0010A925F3|nr:EAL domain-containing protein [Methylophaga sp. SB9B]THK41780.1 EAL domain-containing protein [Methylophaga sp. SB9B]
MNQADNPSRFFSLKWKFALLFGGLLIILNISFPLMIYWDMQHKFGFVREQIQQQYHQYLDGQLESSKSELQRLAEFVLIPANDNPTASELLDLINREQSELELGWNVSVAHVYRRDGKFLGGWGLDVPEFVSQYAIQTAENETSYSQVDCRYQCRQYLLLPILSQDQTEYVMLLGYDISQILLAFSSKTGADLAILSSYASDDQTEDRYLPSWEKYVHALSHFEQNINYLRQFGEIHQHDFHHMQNHIMRPAGLPIEFNMIRPPGSDDVLFVIMENISEQLEELHQSLIRNILFAVLSFLLLGSSLVVFISSPLRRLSKVSKALPLLAKQQYQLVRQSVSSPQHHQSTDELDLLETATVSLTTQLEQLHISVEKQTFALQQERDFVKNLINTAQLIIITLDQQCRITSFNQYAERITGISANEIINKPIQGFFSAEEWPHIYQAFTEIKEKRSSVQQMEADFIHRKDNVRVISWMHSSLNVQNNDSVILSVGVDITEKKHNEDQILWMAEHDALTGLYNRFKFNVEFERILLHAEKVGSKGVLLVLDLDQFKDLNDSCGHNIGDQLLKRVAQVLSKVTRSTDLVARLGGDEFAILLPQTDLKGAEQFCKKIAVQLAELNFIYQHISYHISSSMGLVEFPLAGQGIDALLSNADLAMYQAKAKGKNTWHTFNIDDKTRSHLQNRILWKQKIIDALAEKNQRFIFHYQPILDLTTNKVSHYEALLRLEDADGTLHMPGSFIEVAEQTGLIHQIDHHVLKMGVHKQAEFDQLPTPISLSLNLSAHATSDPELLPRLKRLLRETGAKPGNLIFELTETAAVADYGQAKTMMLKINKLGCQFSLDDFGTGFASFRYMRELPVAIVKIDGAFIRHICDNPDDRLFVKALVDVAKGMGKKTIAEFVEDEAIVTMLKNIGVDYAQGYHIGRPKPALLDDANLSD